MDFADHHNAAVADAADALDIALDAGAHTDARLVECASETIAAFLARLRTPEAIVAWWGEARDRQGGYAEAESDAHSLALSTWLLAVLAGDDD